MPRTTLGRRQNCAQHITRNTPDVLKASGSIAAPSGARFLRHSTFFQRGGNEVFSGGMSGLCHCCCHQISKGRDGASACSVAHDRSLDKSTACARQSRNTRWRTQALCDPAPVARHRWRCRDAQQEWLSSMATAGRERVSVVCVRVGSIVFVSFNTHTGVVSKDTGLCLGRIEGCRAV